MFVTPGQPVDISPYNETPGMVTIATPLASYEFGFAGVGASAAFDRRSNCTIWAERATEAAQGIAVAGRSVVPADAKIMCYGPSANPLPIAELGAVGLGSDEALWDTAGVDDNKVWHFAVLENVVAGFYSVSVADTEPNMETADPGGIGPIGMTATTPVAFDLGVPDGGAGCATPPVWASRGDLLPLSDQSLCAKVPSGFACPVTCAAGLVQVRQLRCEDGAWSSGPICLNRNDTCGPPRHQEWPDFLAGPNLVVPDSVAACGPNTAPGAVCGFTCATDDHPNDTVLAVDHLRCAGGVWAAEPGANCTIVDDVPPPVPLIIQVERRTASSLLVSWNPSWNTVIVPFRGSPPTFYSFNVTNDSVTCRNWHHPVPPVAGMECFCIDEAECNLDNATISVTSHNMAGRSPPSEFASLFHVPFPACPGTSTRRRPGAVQDPTGECRPTCGQLDASLWDQWKEHEGLPSARLPDETAGCLLERSLPGAACSFTCTDGNTTYGSVAVGQFRCSERDGTWAAEPGTVCAPVTEPPPVIVTKVAWGNTANSVIVFWELAASSRPTLPVEAYGFQVSQSVGSTLFCEDWNASVAPVNGSECHCADPARCDLDSVSIAGFTRSEAGNSAPGAASGLLSCPPNSVRGSARQCTCPSSGFAGEVQWSPEKLAYLGACAEVKCPTNAAGHPACTCRPGMTGSLTWDSAIQRYSGNCEYPRCSTGYAVQVQWSPQSQTHTSTCTEVPCPPNAVGHPNCACLAGFEGSLSWNTTLQHYSGSCDHPRCSAGYTAQVYGTGAQRSEECVEVPCPPNAGGHPACACNPGYTGSTAWNSTSQSFTGACDLSGCAVGYTMQVRWSDELNASTTDCLEVPCPPNAVGHPACACMPGFTGSVIWNDVLQRFDDEQSCRHVPCPPGSVQYQGEPCRCDAGSPGNLRWNAALRQYEGFCEDGGSEGTGIEWLWFILTAILEVALLSAGWALVASHRWAQEVSLPAAVLLQLPTTFLVTFFLSELWQADWPTLVLIAWTLLVAKVVLLLVGWPMWRSAAEKARHMKEQLEVLTEYQENLEKERQTARELEPADPGPDFAATLRALGNADISEMKTTALQVSKMEGMVKNLAEEWKVVPKPRLCLLVSNYKVFVYMEVVFHCEEYHTIFKYQVYKLTEWVRFIGFIGLAKKCVVKCTTLDFDELEKNFNNAQNGAAELYRILGWHAANRGGSREVGGTAGLQEIKHLYSMEAGGKVELNQMFVDHPHPTQQERQDKIFELRSHYGEVFLPREYDIPDESSEGTETRFDSKDERKFPGSYTFFDIFEWDKDTGKYVTKEEFRGPRGARGAGESEPAAPDPVPPAAAPGGSPLHQRSASSRAPDATHPAAGTQPPRKTKFQEQMEEMIGQKEQQSDELRHQASVQERVATTFEERCGELQTSLDELTTEVDQHQRKHILGGAAAQARDREVEEVRAAMAQVQRKLEDGARQQVQQERELAESRAVQAHQLEELRQELETLEVSKKATEAEVDKLTQEWGRLDEEKTRARQQLEPTRRREEEKRKAVEELQERNTQVLGSVKASTRRLAQERSKGEEQEQQIEALHTAHARLDSDLAFHQEEANQKQEQVEANEKKLATAEKEAAQAHQEAQQLEGRIEAQAQAHRERKEQLATLVEALERKSSDIGTELMEARTRQGETDGLLHATQGDLKAAQQSGQKLQTEVHAEQRGTKHMERNLDLEQHGVTAIKDDIANLQKEAQRLQEEVDHSSQTKRESEDQLQQMRKEEKERASQLAEEQNSKSRLDGQLKGVQQALEAAKAQVRELHQEHEAAEQEASTAGSRRTLQA